MLRRPLCQAGLAISFSLLTLGCTGGNTSAGGEGTGGDSAVAEPSTPSTPTSEQPIAPTPETTPPAMTESSAASPSSSTTSPRRDVDVAMPDEPTPSSQPPSTAPPDGGDDAASSHSIGNSAAEDAASEPADSRGALWDLPGLILVRPDDPLDDGCGAPFMVGGEHISLITGGFEPFAQVQLTEASAELPDALLGEKALAPVQADGNGNLDVQWTAPTMPSAAENPRPRAYGIRATGTAWGGGELEAHMAAPLVVYPGTAPCAVNDAVTVTYGEPVQIDVLANDIAPDGGSLDRGSIETRAFAGGELKEIDAEGRITLMMEPGFAATTTVSYVVYDNWGIGVEGEIAVTIDPGCTITFPEGITEVTGTDGDDVICAPDLADTFGFADYGAHYVIDAGAGDDLVFGSKGDDWIYGGDGDDEIYGREGDDILHGHGGDDILHGGSYDDTLHGGAGVDTCTDGETVEACEN